MNGDISLDDAAFVLFYVSHIDKEGELIIDIISEFATDKLEENQIRFSRAMEEALIGDKPKEDYSCIMKDLIEGVFKYFSKGLAHVDTRSVLIPYMSFVESNKEEIHKILDRYENLYLMWQSHEAKNVREMF